jgi:divalent metal cation (Fe/Co/Zn/Cd) transporter
VLAEQPGVDDVVQLMTMALGPSSLLVAARLDLADDLGSVDVETLARELDERLRDAVPAVQHVFLDPTHRDELPVSARSAGPAPAGSPR